TLLSCRSPPTRACRSRRSCAVRRAASQALVTRVIKKSRCRAISTSRNGETRLASSLANAQASTPCEERAALLERAAERLEQHRGELLSLLQNEAGKTLDDALAELREAVDYCRYYAAQARDCLAA